MLDLPETRNPDFLGVQHCFQGPEGQVKRKDSKARTAEKLYRGLHCCSTIPVLELQGMHESMGTLHGQAGD